MGKGKSKACKLRESKQIKVKQEFSPNTSSSARNLRVEELGAVIFGCKNHTFSECLTNKIFGLPAAHYSYVQKITPGLTLFLFNCSDRSLHGIFEAATHGQLNMNSNAWAAVEGADVTPYPAQVRINIRKLCSPLIEKSFKPLIADNYVTETKIWFELDKDQANRLTQLFLMSPYRDNKISRKLNKEKARNLVQSFLSPSNSKNPMTQNACGKKSLCDESLSVEMNNDDNQSHESTPGKKWSELFKPSSSSSPCLSDEQGSNLPKWSDLLKPSSSSPPRLLEKPSLSVMDDEAVSEIEQVNLDPSMCDYSDTEWEMETVYEENPEIETSTNMIPVLMNNEEASGIDKLHVDPNVSDDPGSDCESNLSASSYETAPLFLEPWSDIPDEELEGCTEARDMVATVQVHEENSGCHHMLPDGCDSMMMELVQELEAMKLFSTNQSEKVDSLKHQLVGSKAEIEELKKYLNNLESTLPSTGYYYITENEEKERQSEESVFIIGGSDGSTWFQDMNSYFPSEDKFVSLCPMKTVRSFAAATSLNGEVYLLGGLHDGVWYDTVESYNPARNQWIQRPSLNKKKGSIAGASVCDRIFAMGGGNGAECFSDVEIFDLIIGRWIFTESMLEKRVALAAADLNGVLYVSGGYDGRNYLRTVERFDPREAKWTRLSSMKSKRGSHSMVAFNEKLYALGGYDGNTMSSSVEVFDPRVGRWNMAESMILSRGYFGSFVLNGKLYALGGLDEKQEVLDLIECYEEAGSGWQLHGQTLSSKRCFFSTLVM